MPISRFDYDPIDGSLTPVPDVDEGNTITDFLPAERARGVTIQSAAISFNWPPLPPPGDGRPGSLNSGASSIALQEPHNINLIDTPGHADFNFEVLRSLRILDGAVCILDGVAGVEAQTEKVWSQAANFQIPKIIYINKLDRDGASFAKTVQEIASRLHAWPAVCQIPWWEGGKGRFTGLGDPVNLQAYRWPEKGDGKFVDVVGLDELFETDRDFCQEIKRARESLLELLSAHDEALVAKFLEFGEAIPATEIIASLRRCVLEKSCNVVPVFGGASYRNIGVQPLLDAVVQLLPSPDEAPDPEISLGNVSGTMGDVLEGRLTAFQPKSSRSGRQIEKGMAPQSVKAIMQNLKGCALAFKVVHNPHHGVLVYVRVYFGTIRRGAALFNTNLQVSEKALSLWRMYAKDSVNIDEIPAGQIGVIPGLKFTRTGDTLVSYAGVNPKSKPPAPVSSLQLQPIEIPPAVFFASIEPDSLGEEKAVSNALALLIREDPSLQLSVDEESGQIQLSGMGELHLEIAGDRLVKEFKVRATVGRVEVAYRESILVDSTPQSYLFDKESAGKRSKAACEATVHLESPTSSSDELADEESVSTTQDGNTITTTIAELSPSGPNTSAWSLPIHLSAPVLHSSLLNGALATLSRGSTYFYPCHGVHVNLTIDPTSHIFGTETIPNAISSAARLATRAALQDSAKRGGSAILETVMKVVISVDEASFGAVTRDLCSTRGGRIMSLEDEADVVTRQPIDLSKVYAPPDPFATSFDTIDTSQGTGHREIVARVPLQEMVGYVNWLRKLTAGRGTFVMTADSFERVSGHRKTLLLKKLEGR